MNAQVVLAADGGEVKSKLTSAGKTIQGILTGLVVLVGICVALFIIIKRIFFNYIHIRDFDKKTFKTSTLS